VGYNISEVSGSATSAGGLDDWVFDADLSDTSLTTITGDFDVTSVFGGGSTGEADIYTVSPLSTTAWGTLSLDSATGELTFTIDRAAVIASGSDQVVTFTITGTSGANTDTDNVTINLLICVARGTRIATPDGEIAVEELTPGRTVLMADGRAEPIRWIGSRRITREELDRDPALRPIRIRPDAFGAGRPARDLRVSPQHRILLDDWRSELLFGETRTLAPAKGLVNDRAIVVDRTCDEVEYFHLLFDRHEIILTEGLPTESFYPGSYALTELDRDAHDELCRLFPEFRDHAAYGAPAAPGLRPWEARLLSEESD
jgi:VCBS repeat-containing protein